MGLGSALGAAVIGVTLGMFVGYKGGWADRLVLKISDVFLSFPQMVLIIIMVALVGQSLRNMILIFILTGWPSMYRMARSKVLSLKEAEFVQALTAFGISPMKIAFKHLLPNTVGPIVVNITLSTAMFILQEASLSVLGYGVPQEIATCAGAVCAGHQLYRRRTARCKRPDADRLRRMHYVRKNRRRRAERQGSARQLLYQSPLQQGASGRQL